MEITQKQFKKLQTKKGIRALLRNESMNAEKAIKFITYEKRLEKLQEEMIKLLNWVVEKEKKLVIIFEGRDAAGKGGAIRRITENLNPRQHRVVALPKPNEVEQGQWYFQRYINQLPKAGEIVFFDRSWYNRAVVEPVNGFCTDEEYKTFMEQVNQFEAMLVDSGTQVLKLYFSISKEEQIKRFEEIKNSPVKRWKFSKVDEKALELWDKYTEYKEKMFHKTNTKKIPWKVVKANKKSKARIEALEYILKEVPYEAKDFDRIKHKELD
ncbi:MAG: polyphosphate kinase 2 [Flavobacteriales bacterium]|nr:MAG: polyphosphate kinase 2 [Flavobacteriales bacterium]